MNDEIKIIDLNHLGDRMGKDYYFVVIDHLAENYLIVKNPSCRADIENYLMERYNLLKNIVENRFSINFNGTDSEINLERLSKKYHKYLKWGGK